MNTDFKSIPFDFLLNWSKTQKTNYPELTYVTTLDKSGTCQVVGDIFDSSRTPNKRLNELQAKLIMLEDKINTAYGEDCQVHIIPSVISPSMIDSLAGFIKEFAAIRGDQLKNVNKKYVNAGALRIKVFRLYYMPSSTIVAKIFERADVASVVGTSPQRVEQVIKELITECRDILLGQTVDKVAADISLSSWYTNLSKSLANATTLSDFRNQTGLGENDPYTERFLVDLLGYSLSKRDNNPVLVKGSITAFYRKIGQVVTHFRNYSIPMPIAEFEAYLNSTLKNDDTLRDDIHDYVLSSEQFERMYDGGGHECVALRWENLEFFPSEVARLMYDNNIFTLKDAWDKDTIIREYNIRASLFEKKHIRKTESFVLRHNLILHLGKSGYYKLKTSFTEKFVNANDFSKEYVRAHKSSLSLTDFLAECKEKGYIHLYGDLSMRTFFNMACKPLKGTIRGKVTTAQIMKAIATTLSQKGGAVRVPSLKKEVESVIGSTIPEASFRAWLNRADGDLVSLSRKGRACYVSLRPIDISKYDFSNINHGVRKAPYMTLVVSTAVDELRRAPGHKMKLMDLKKKLENLIPSDIATTNIYKIFSKSDLFLKTNTGNKKGDKYIQLNPAKYKELYTNNEIAAPVITGKLKQQIITTPAQVSGGGDMAFEWEKLKDILFGQFKNWIKDDGIDLKKILSEMYKIMKGDAKDLESGDEFYKSLSLLNDYYTKPTSPIDRELLCIKLILGTEPYLKSLYKISSGTEIDGVNGLGTVINKMQSEYYLPTNTDQTQVGQRIYKMIGYIINSRNALHNNFEGESSQSLINSKLDTFLKFYILVAAYSLYYII